MDVKSRNINRLYYRLLLYGTESYNGYIANEMLQEIATSTPLVEGKECILKLSMCTTAPCFPLYIVDWYFELRTVGIKSADRDCFIVPICNPCLVLYLGMMTRYVNLIRDTVHVGIKNARLIKQADISKISGATSQLKDIAYENIERLTKSTSRTEISIGESIDDLTAVHIDITQLRELGKVTIIYNLS